MPFHGNGGGDCARALLMAGVMDGNFRQVEAALTAGANVNGSPGCPFAPVMAATVANHAGMVDFLLEQGADPDRPVTEELRVSCACSAPPFALPGATALQLAAKNNFIDIARLLLKRSGVDPNATDSKGVAPLNAACASPHVCGKMVRLLLDAGADPTLATGRGLTPLHGLAHGGHVDLVNMLHFSAPATLNHCSVIGTTPLFVACSQGHESTVSKLLSLGARQRVPSEDNGMFPLVVAVIEGFAGVVRVLVNKGGLKEIGGEDVLAAALYRAVVCRRPTILRLLLAAEGEEMRSGWANINIEGRRLLHYGAGSCGHTEVSILLEAGAREAARDDDGRIPRDVIGVDIGIDDAEVHMDRGKEVAMRQILQRGPAYRPRSWAWPSDQEAGAGGSGDGDAAGAAGAAAVLSPPPAAKTSPVVGGRIFRPKEKNSRGKLFVRLVGRYCAKG